MHQGVPWGVGEPGPTSGAGEAAQAQGAVTPRRYGVSGGNGDGGSGICLANKKTPHLKCSQSCCVSAEGGLIHTLTSVNLF